MMKMSKNVHIIISSCCSLFLLVLSSSSMAVAAARNSNSPVNVGVGVVLDFDTGFGKMGLSCINMSLSEFYASHPNYTTRLLLHRRSSPTDVVLTAAAALDLLNNVQVQAIIGPDSSMQANFVINLGHKAHVPIISFSATSPSLTSIRSPYFIRAAQNDSLQVKTISALIQAFGWRQVVPIYVDNEFGEGVIPYLADALQEADVLIPYRLALPSTANDDQIEIELGKLMVMQTRVFIIHMLPELGSRVFEKARKLGMMDEGYVWIMTDGICNLFSDNSSNSVVENMQGVLGVKTYVPSTNELKGFRARWKKKFHQEYPGDDDVDLGVFGLWAYDAAHALALAVEEVVINGNKSLLGFEKGNSTSSNDLERIGVSKIGPQLVKALSRTNFKGLSGDFNILNGQLQSSIFQVVNVIGNWEKVIGYWTPEKGLLSNLNSKTAEKSSYSTSNTSLGSIIWPGDSISAPKGWQIPIIRKKLRILVPVKKGLKEFVNVSYDPITKLSKVVGGYCIDVFKAVRDNLPYDIEYEFVAYARPNGSMNGSYNDLVNEVYLGNYDAAVGDITIRANRTLYIDYTLPFTESGVSMIVPIKDDKEKNAWVFLKPLTWDLWATSGCFFIFIGFVVWVLEHRINEDFRGPPLHQIGTSFWFSFSTMVFAHRERVVSNLARFVVIIWCFVVLILTQSYTASLTSRLTVQQLQPTVTDVNLLIKTRQNVGYQTGSFVYGILKQLGFQNENLKAYDTVEQLNELLRNGTTKNGIAAAFDENPYMKLFLATYCSKYTMVEPTFKADGFAFVFPKNSPLARDVSRAILNVNEGGDMQKIESRWFRKQDDCQNSGINNVESNSLSLESFWGLFLIAGVASSLALLIHVAMFLYEHKDIPLDSESSFWRKVRVMLRIYDQKDLSSHTFKKKGLEFHNNYPSSPSGFSNNTEAHNVSAEQITPVASPELGGLSPASQSAREIELAIEHP